MLNIEDSLLQAPHGAAYPLRSLAWSGRPIADACPVQASYGHVLVLSADGGLHGVDLDNGACVELCKIAPPPLPDNPGRTAASLRLHATHDGTYCAVVADRGQHGVVVETRSGSVTMQLDGGDYHAEQVPFSACFLYRDGRHVIVHRSAWNRLDAADAASGSTLTGRTLAPPEPGKHRAEHELDYCHGQLRPSPDGSRLYDDGWVWAPVAVPSAWSVTDWLDSNPWESEDGPSLVRMAQRDDWNIPACWIDASHVAIWGKGDWDYDEFEEVGKGPGVRIYSALPQTPPPADGCWPMALDEDISVSGLFCDQRYLYVAADTGTTVWDLATRAQRASLPAFRAHFHHPTRASLVAVAADKLLELPLAWLARA